MVCIDSSESSLAKEDQGRLAEDGQLAGSRVPGLEGLAGLGKGLGLYSKWHEKGLKGAKHESYRGPRGLLCREWPTDGIKMTTQVCCCHPGQREPRGGQ